MTILFEIDLLMFDLIMTNSCFLIALSAQLPFSRKISLLVFILYAKQFISNESNYKRKSKVFK